MPSDDFLQNDSARTDRPPAARCSTRLTGSGASGGIVIGRAVVFGQDMGSVPEVVLAPDQIDPEVSRFEAALCLSEQQLGELRHKVAHVIGERDAAIFDAHLMLVGDQGLAQEVIAKIRSTGRNAEYAFREVIDHYSQALQAVDDSYIRDRLVDIQDVAARVVRNLQGREIPDLGNLSSPCVIVAHDLAPSQTAVLDRRHVLGFVTCIGSQTSHTAIMARALGIPAVVGASGATAQIADGDELIVDGLRGVVIVRPSAEELVEYRERIAAQVEWTKKIEAELDLPAETQDGFRVSLAVNIELPEEVPAIKQRYGVGIGLFRSEYLFVTRETPPDEEEQFRAYRQVAEEIFPQSVIIRTLDIGGDKFISHLPMPSELNPFLGLRAIRFCLSRPDVFMGQLRAILRASAFGKVRILFPMISTLEELQQSLAALKRAQAELDEQGIAYNPHLDVGTMIEVPSAALLADHLAPHVDFFSIGTNDLIQYSLAVDRANPDIAHLYQPTHPAIIRLLRGVVEAAAVHGKWVGMCGEMAGDPVLVPLVLGLGIHELSLAPPALGVVKRLVRRLRMCEAEQLVAEAAACATAADVRRLCVSFVRRAAPELLRRDEDS